MASTTPQCDMRRDRVHNALAAIPGVTFGDALTYFAEKQDERDARIAQMARDEWHRDGEIEIDEYAKGTAIVSEGDDNGAYVMAWVWVDFCGTELDKEPDEEASDGPTA